MNRHRAPAMSTDERRAAIVAAAMPLLIEHGGKVPTSKIAAAAGIAEGTVFRAFKDKAELLAACFQAAMESDEEVDRIAAIDRVLPLPERLLTALGQVRDYQNRLWSVAQAIRASGADMHQMRSRGPHGPEDQPPRAMLRVVAAVGDLFDPETDRLRVPPDLAARLLLGFMMAAQMPGADLGGEIAEPAEIVDLFLNGVLTPDTPKPPRETL
ncbi:MAG TPA: TetR/AcrR family transcriptional regulator [Pseudonocardiaceae bacterium]